MLGACRPNSASGPLSQAAQRGRAVYQSSCIACHNADPKQDGPLGPAVFGSSLELLEARVLGGEYPAGYTPKRASRTMQPLPHLRPQLADLQAFLAAPVQ